MKILLAWDILGKFHPKHKPILVQKLPKLVWDIPNYPINKISAQFKKKNLRHSFRLRVEVWCKASLN